jgi:undecaprenyl-diphosphatase
MAVEHPIRDAAIDVLGGTPKTLERAPVDPAVLVLPAPLARRIRTFDQTVDAWFDQLRGNHVADRVLYGASTVGDFSLIWHVAGVARALGGKHHERESLRLVVALGAESALINGVVKSWFRRTRPDHQPHLMRKLRRPKTSSFPSGHATSAFMAANLLGSGRRPATKVAWYGVATVVAASRIHVKIHHASDVVAGAAIGVGMGAAVKKLWPIGNARTRRGY